ncbi:MAG TPA: hypothetical protein VHX62_07405 [Solirubrobacteraceae bacterium]|nr:hypothetical protein [Solirubrobacteraceae bacterium]
MNLLQPTTDIEILEIDDVTGRSGDTASTDAAIPPPLLSDHPIGRLGAKEALILGARGYQVGDPAVSHGVRLVAGDRDRGYETWQLAESRSSDHRSVLASSVRRAAETQAGQCATRRGTKCPSVCASQKGPSEWGDRGEFVWCLRLSQNGSGSAIVKRGIGPEEPALCGLVAVADVEQFSDVKSGAQPLTRDGGRLDSPFGPLSNGLYIF